MDSKLMVENEILEAKIERLILDRTQNKMQEILKQALIQTISQK